MRSPTLPPSAPDFRGVDALCDAVMRGVVRTDILRDATSPQIDRACEIMRAEVRALLTGKDDAGKPAYEAERAVVQSRSMGDGWVVASVILRCVERIQKEVA